MRAVLLLDPAALIMASGSGGTQGGLVLGLHTIGRAIDVVGFSVSDPADKQRAKVIDIADRCATHLGCRPIDSSLVIVEDSTLGPGYGQQDERTLEAIRLFASTGGIVLDPVYTGKAAAGLVEGCRSGRFAADQQVVFLHTGGQAGAFAYQPVFG